MSLPLLLKISEANSETIDLAFGKSGKKIKIFIDTVDLDHPEVETLFDTETSEFWIELLDLADFAVKGNKKKITKVFENVILDKAIDNCFSCRIRLLRTQEERDKMRLEKEMQSVDLVAISKKGEEIWYSQPDDFSGFVRGSIAYEEEIEIANKKVNRYVELGCMDMAKQIYGSIETFKNKTYESYYGFNRITMTNASIILAKLLKYKLRTFWSRDVAEKKSYSIAVSSFKKYNFDIDGRKDVYDYEPRVYPMHKLTCIMPSRIKTIVNRLDDFISGTLSDKINGKAIFDNYNVLVPSVAYPRNEIKDSYSILGINGKRLDFSNREDAVHILDINLIECGCITPVLLGERDGKCFFVAPFTI